MAVLFSLLFLVLGLGVWALDQPATTPESVDGPDDDERPVPTDAQLRGLVDEYGRLMYRVAYGITHDRMLAEDVVQDALVQAWTSIPSWEGDVPVRWLRRVTRNRAISVMRKELRSIPEDQWESLPGRTADPGRVVEGRELMTAVRNGLQLLDEQARTMIVLRETEEMSYEDIAAIVDLTPAVVKTRLYRARHVLKKHLDDWDLA